MKPLLYVGQQVADVLRDRVGENLERYREGDFRDLEGHGDWRIALSVEADLDRLAELDRGTGAKAEVANSLLVGRVLERLTPSLARENRLWIRLSHVEALEYSRARWLEGKKEEELEKQVVLHFFAPTLTSCRDDHAISRLWWNYRIASQIMPDEPERALIAILATADIRQALIERPGIGARSNLARGVLLMIEDQASGLRASESLFRAFMKRLNLKGAGMVFEVWPEGRIHDFMRECLDDVRENP